jgi:hypothetical protein
MKGTGYRRVIAIVADPVPAEFVAVQVTVAKKPEGLLAGAVYVAWLPERATEPGPVTLHPDAEIPLPEVLNVKVVDEPNATAILAGATETAGVPAVFATSVTEAPPDAVEL